MHPLIDASDNASRLDLEARFMYRILFCVVTREGRMKWAIHTHRFLYLIVATTLLCFTGRGALAQTCDAPDPTDFKVSAPGPSVAPDAAAFSGVWAGSWLLAGNAALHPTPLCVRIHVSVEDSDRASVAYCYGSRSDVGTAPQCDLYQAIIRGPYLIFFTSDGINISMRLKGPGAAQAQGDFPHNLPTLITDFRKL